MKKKGDNEDLENGKFILYLNGFNSLNLKKLQII